MAENYTVNYNINVKAESATTALTKFQTAVTNLTNASSQLKKFGTDVEELATKLNATKINIQLGKGVMATLNQLIAKLREIDKLSKRAGVINNAVNKTTSSTGTTRRIRNSKSKSIPRTSEGYPIVRTSDNLSYKAFGPTPLPSNGGIAVDMMKGMGLAYGISGIGQAISSIVEQASGFDNTMKTVENILKSHDGKGDFSGRFSSMSQVIRNVGMETKFKVTEVADAAKFLAMAGLDVETIRQAIRPIADIALVGDTDLGETADLVTNIMTAYNIKSDKMRQAADVMTNTFTMSNTTLTEIAESYKYAASLLSTGGVKFEEATAAIGVLGDAGIKGSQAGTTLRTIMANIVNPTKKQKAAWDSIGVATVDKNGNARSLLDIFMDLNKKNLDVSAYYKLFNKTAASGAAALASHADKWNAVNVQNYLSAGLSADLANAKKNTLQGMWAQVTSTFTDTGVKAFNGIQGGLRMWMQQAIDWLKSDDALRVFRDVANTIMELAQTVINATQLFYKWFKAVEPFVKLWVKFQLVIWPVVQAVQALKSVWIGLQGFGAISKGISSATKSMLGFASASEQAAVASGAVATGGTIVAGPNPLGVKGLQNSWYNKRRRLHKLERIADRRTKYWKNQTGAGSNETESAYSRLARLQKQRAKLSGRKGFFRSVAADYWNHTKKNIIPNAIGTMGNIARTGVGALGAYAAMNKLTDADANKADYVAGGLYAGAGLAAMAGGPVGWGLAAAAGLSAVVAEIWSAHINMDKLRESLEAFVKSNRVIDGVLIDSNSRTLRALEFVWRKNYDINELIERRIQLTAELSGMDLSRNPEAKDVGNDIFKDIYGQFYKNSHGWSWYNDLQTASEAVKMFNEQFASSGISINGDHGYYELMVQGRRSKSYGSNIDAVMYDVAAALQEVHGGYASKIIEEQTKSLSEALYSKYSTVADLKEMRRSLFYKYDPDLQKKGDLTRPGEWNVSGSEARNWTGEDIYHSYAAASATWQTLQPFIRDSWTPVFNLKKKLENDVKTITESDVVEAIRGTDTTLSTTLQDYMPTNPLGWFSNAGWSNGAWHQIGVASPQQNATLASQNMLRLVQALDQLGPAIDPATKNLRTFAEVFYTLAQGVLGEGNPIKGTIVGEKRTVNGTDWLWDNDKQVWLNKDVDGAQMTPEEMGKAFGKGGNKKTMSADNGVGGGSAGGGAKASDYSNHYNKNSAAPKQVIVRINNLMNVQSVDLANPDKAAVVANLKGELAQALIDVVHDFDETWHG